MCTKRCLQQIFAMAGLIIFIWACNSPLNNKSPFGKGGGGIHTLADTDVGNNLSFPVIWSDLDNNSLQADSLLLRGSYKMEPLLNGQYFEDNNTKWYLQNRTGNVWQADTKDESQIMTSVSLIDWGDNLEARSWPDGSQVRVEIVLYKLLGSNSLHAFPMKPRTDQPIIDPVPTLRPDQVGTSEIWGTNGVSTDKDTATVYATSAMLVIQKLNSVPVGESPDINWSKSDLRWTGEDVDSDFIFQGAVWDGSFSAEVNVQGKVIYGYNWITSSVGAGPGYYRLTFVLVDNLDLTQKISYTDFNDQTSIFGNGEVVVSPDETHGGGRTSSGGKAMIIPNDNLTYIDVQLTPTRGGGKSGNGGGGNGTGNKGQGKGGGRTGNGGHGHITR